MLTFALISITSFVPLEIPKDYAELDERIPSENFGWLISAEGHNQKLTVFH